MRIRVKYDVSRPLRRVIKLSLGPKYPSLGLLLRYERLPEFCYICGILGHINKDCAKKDSAVDLTSLHYSYGAWLRAENEEMILPPVDVLIHSSTLSTQRQSTFTDADSSSVKPPILESRITVSEKRSIVDLIGNKRGPPMVEMLDEQLDTNMEENEKLFHPMNKRRSVKSSASTMNLDENTDGNDLIITRSAAVAQQPRRTL